MYLTKDVLCGLIQQTTEAMEELEQYKSRGSGRYVPNDKRTFYLMNRYERHIARRLLEMVEKGNYSIDRVVKALEEQDWERYSFSNKAFYGDKLAEVLMRKKSTSYISLLMEQAVYLEQASKEVIEYIRE